MKRQDFSKMSVTKPKALGGKRKRSGDRVCVVMSA